VRKRKELNMNKNLYVGNLSAGVSDEDLKANFAKAGEVATVNVIKDKFSGQSRGFGFVEMATEEGAKAAIEMFNGGTLDGNTISVNEARPKKEGGAPRSGGPRSGGPRGGGGFGGGRGGGGFGGGRGGSGSGGGRSRY
jgi:cold-inducible RNA-binding protein